MAPIIDATRLFSAGLLGLVCLLPCGCAKKGPPTKVVFGSVTCDGEKVPLGRVLFVPIENASGPNCAAMIMDGQYRIDARGGVPVGKYRVCVDARKKTCRRVSGSVGTESAMIDEEVRIGPELYAGDQSPLVADVRADSDGKVDLVIPQQ